MILYRLKNSKFMDIAQHLPTFVLLVIIIAWIRSGEGFSIDRLWSYTPRSYFAAVIFFLLIYAVKSLSFLIPIVVVYVAAGSIFGPFTALVVNIVGAGIVVTIPYWIGYHFGAGFAGNLLSRYKKVEAFIKNREGNSWFISCFPRTIAFLPLKTISVYLGSLKVPYFKYLLGSILGLMPLLLSITLAGASITKPSSPTFIISVIVMVLSAGVSVGVYFWMEYVRKRKDKETEADG